MGLFDLFSNDDAEQAAAQRNAGLQQGYDTLSGLYGQGRDALTTGANTASNLYAGLGDYFKTNYAPGASAYGDASGANGVAGLQRADQTFKNSGQYGTYGFTLGQGLQALDRTHAAAGNLASGNADADTLNYATGLASKTYSDYLAGLSPYLGLDATGETAATQGQANAATGLATGLNTSFQGQGTAANANYTGQGASNAAATMNNYNVGSNILGAITGVGGLISGGLGGGLTSGLSGLFSSFDGPSTGTTAPGVMGGVRYPQF